jgi:hypothetical protein
VTAVKVWTIQPIYVWRTLQDRGTLHVDPARVVAPHFVRAYDWLADQMRQRLGSSSSGSPWWGWNRWDGLRRPKPDLRTEAWHYPRGDEHVRIELDLPADQVLLSDYDAWHFVLTGSFLSPSEKEDDAFDAECDRAGLGSASDERLKVEPFRSRILASWQRVFDLRFGDSGWLGPPEDRRIQATFWTLEMAHVRAVTRFEGRALKRA